MCFFLDDMHMHAMNVLTHGGLSQSQTMAITDGTAAEQPQLGRLTDFGEWRCKADGVRGFSTGLHLMAPFKASNKGCRSPLTTTRFLASPPDGHLQGH